MNPRHYGYEPYALTSELHRRWERFYRNFPSKSIGHPRRGRIYKTVTSNVGIVPFGGSKSSLKGPFSNRTERSVGIPRLKGLRLTNALTYRMIIRDSRDVKLMDCPVGLFAEIPENVIALSPCPLELKTRVATLPRPLNPLATSGLEKPMVHMPPELSMFCRKEGFFPNCWA